LPTLLDRTRAEVAKYSGISCWGFGASCLKAAASDLDGHKQQKTDVVRAVVEYKEGKWTGFLLMAACDFGVQIENLFIRSRDCQSAGL
jgi:hypothetical protein